MKVMSRRDLAGRTFSEPVAIYGETILVGAEDDNGQGAAYVFVRDGLTWTEQQQIKIPSITLLN